MRQGRSPSIRKGDSPVYRKLKHSLVARGLASSGGHAASSLHVPGAILFLQVLLNCWRLPIEYFVCGCSTMQEGNKFVLYYSVGLI